MVKTLNIEYRDDTILLEGYYAYDEKIAAKRPAVMVVHDWSGKNNFACQKAEKLAELGYVGFALDIFGKGKLGKTKEEKSAFMQPFIKDRRMLLKRMLAALDVVKNLETVDAAKIGVMGFCFGGLCALDLARSGTDILAAVSFHGLLMPPENLASKHIKAKVLALHGYNDPMVTPDQVMQFANEMTAAKADWEINIYGNAMHAFTNPEANDPEFGTVYEKKADFRSWLAMKEFFKESFGQ